MKRTFVWHFLNNSVPI